ncbi:MAG: hypothetical protein QF752_14980 [Planctomycetota bacterium]|jgi:hypothetical protein|nr:hypothetical protein [Planctomycetota bacterium]
MPRLKDVLFGEIAVRTKLLSRQKLKKCLHLQKAESSKRKIGQIFVDEGYLDEERRTFLVEFQQYSLDQKHDLTDHARGSGLFGQILLNLGFLDEKSLHAAIREQAAAEERGILFRLGEILVGNGHLSPAELLMALRIQNKRIVVCQHCGTRFNLRTESFTSSTPCSKCGQPLDPRTSDSNPMVQGTLRMKRPDLSKTDSSSEIDSTSTPEKNVD